MTHFNPIGQPGDAVGLLILRPTRKWIAATIQSVSLFSDEVGQWHEFYSVRAINGNGYAFKKTVTRDRLSICQHLLNTR